MRTIGLFVCTGMGSILHFLTGRRLGTRACAAGIKSHCKHGPRNKQLSRPHLLRLSSRGAYPPPPPPWGHRGAVRGVESQSPGKNPATGESAAGPGCRGGSGAAGGARRRSRERWSASGERLRAPPPRGPRGGRRAGESARPPGPPLPGAGALRPAPRRRGSRRPEGAGRGRRRRRAAGAEVRTGTRRARAARSAGPPSLPARGRPATPPASPAAGARGRPAACETCADPAADGGGSRPGEAERANHGLQL